MKCRTPQQTVLHSRLTCMIGLVALLVILATSAATRATAQNPPLNQSLEAASSNRQYQAQRVTELVSPALAEEREYKRLMGKGMNSGQDPAPGSVIFNLRAELESLKAEKESSLLDMRNGAFCRACHRTRSQIEAGGEAWQHHLDDNSGGHAIPATPEELASKAQEFDGRIAAKQQELSDAEKRAFHASSRRLELGNQIDSVRIVWITATQFECYHHTQAWERERQATQQKIDVLRTQSISLQGAIKSAVDPVAQRSLVTTLDSLTRQMSSLRNDLIARRGVYFSRLDTFRREADTQRRSLEALVATLGDDFFQAGSGLASSWNEGYNALFPYDLSSVGGVPAGAVMLPGVTPLQGGSPTPADVRDLLEGVRSPRP